MSYCNRCNKMECICACPKCKTVGSLVFDEVDVGIGVMVGPAACMACMEWSEQDEEDDVA